LAQSTTASGNPILFANNQQYDIANAALLGLKNTELIALSACQTAKEANADGKEISGLAYVLERAGAKAVIASLWNTEDNTSSAIMTQFYNNLQQGMSKSEAMRQAKLSQINLHPWFWSPFILIGDAGK
jgi:CHAT domain-containing protein